MIQVFAILIGFAAASPMGQLLKADEDAGLFMLQSKSTVGCVGVDCDAGEKSHNPHHQDHVSLPQSHTADFKHRIVTKDLQSELDAQKANGVDSRQASREKMDVADIELPGRHGRRRRYNYADGGNPPLLFQTEIQPHVPHHKPGLLMRFGKSLQVVFPVALTSFKNDPDSLPVVLLVASMMLCSVIWACLLWRFSRRSLDEGSHSLLADAAPLVNAEEEVLWLMLKRKSFGHSALPLVNVEEAPPTPWTASRMFSTPVQEPFGLSVVAAEGVES